MAKEEKWRYCVLFVIFGLAGVVSAESGVSVGVQRAWSTVDDRYVITCGYMLKTKNRDFEYYEGGVVALPAGRSGVTVNDFGMYSRRYQNSAYGFYGGYFLYLMPVLRPGILFGTTVRDDVTYASRDGHDYYRYSYSNFRLDYYVALSVQIGFFSVTASNYGIGCGINYMW
jgi:hypothetical protein